MYLKKMGNQKNMPERAARGGTMQLQRRRRLSIGTTAAAAVAAAAAAAAAASAAPSAEGFHVAPAQLARGTRRAKRSTRGQADGCCYSRLRRQLCNRDGAGVAALALTAGGGGGTGLRFCSGEGAGRGGRSVAPARARTGWARPSPTVTRTLPAFSRQNERRHSGVGSHAGGGWQRPTAASQHRRRRRGTAAAVRGGEGLGARFSASPLTMAAGRGRDGNSFRKRGDLPSLVVGAGLLLARTRSSQRADHERREVAVDTGAGGGQSSLNEEEAATVAEVGSGAQRPAITAASAGLTAGAGESSSSFSFSSPTGLRRSGAGGREARQQQQRQNSNLAPDSLEAPRRRRGDPAEWEEMGEWRQQGEEGGAEEMEMSLAEEEWTEVREAATQETQLRRRQQRLYREGEEQQQQGQQSRSVLASSSPHVLEVSLDRSVMPEPVVPSVMWGTTTASFLVVVAVTARIPRLLGAVGSTVTVGNTLDPVETPAAAVAGKLASAFPGLRYGARLWAGSLESWASRRSQQWAEAFGPEAVVLPANDWSVCTLLEKVREGDGGLYRYRFGLPSSPDAVLPLELGQELTLCGLDAFNQVAQGNYVPLTPRKQRGAFEVVVMKATDGAELDDGLPTTRSNREFSRFLDNLPLGDEIAVKPGRAGLVYGGANQPITDLVLVANGVGVVPMIQMVNELLPSSSSSVASASVVWLNEKAEDFALYSKLEKAFFRNHRKLDVSCIVERDLFGSHLEANADVNAASPEFKIGTLAAVAGPDFFTRKVTDYLVRRGYPEDAIISL
ncbi:unnamed protein product [Ectocarpus sp. 4 AP-2014]